jgi:ketosteroid isomerase-like protein
LEHDAIQMIRAITAAFDDHDLDGIMAHFADDAVFEGPRGPDPWGQRFVGIDEVRNAFAGRFSGIRISATRQTNTSLMGTEGHRSGRCRARPPRGNGSRSAAAISGGFEIARS